jgi:type IV pilus assembly protein PilZ
MSPTDKVKLDSEQIRQMLAKRLSEKKNTPLQAKVNPLLGRVPAVAEPRQSLLDPLDVNFQHQTQVSLSIDPSNQAPIPRATETETAFLEQPDKPSLLQFALRDLPTLYVSYIPLLKNGGIFVPTSRPYSLGDKMYLSLTLPYDSKKYTLPCTVVWINPVGVSGGAAPGVGLHFPEDTEAQVVHQKILDLLSRIEKAPSYTHTF